MLGMRGGWTMAASWFYTKREERRKQKALKAKKKAEEKKAKDELKVKGQTG
jgi:hypothetical protein